METQQDQSDQSARHLRRESSFPRCFVSTDLYFQFLPLTCCLGCYGSLSDLDTITAPQTPLTSTRQTMSRSLLTRFSSSRRHPRSSPPTQTRDFQSWKNQLFLLFRALERAGTSDSPEGVEFATRRCFRFCFVRFL